MVSILHEDNVCKPFAEAGNVLLKSLMSDLSVEKGSPRFLVYLKAIRASKRANCDREQKAV